MRHTGAEKQKLTEENVAGDTEKSGKRPKPQENNKGKINLGNEHKKLPEITPDKKVCKIYPKGYYSLPLCNFFFLDSRQVI